MGNGTSQVGGDQPGVVTLPEITFEVELPKPEAKKPEDKAGSPPTPSPEDYKKLVARAQSLGLKLDFLDEAGNVKPDKVEEVKARVQQALEAKIKATQAQYPNLKPDDRTVTATTYLPFLVTDTEFSLLSPADQKAFLASSPLNKEATASYQPTQRPPHKQMAQAIRLEALRQETNGDVGNASRLYDTAVKMDPESNFLRLQAGNMKRKWAEQESDPIIKAHLYEEAVAHYDAHLKKNPDDKLAKEVKGSLLFEEGKNLKLWADKVSDPKEKKRLLTKALGCTAESAQMAEDVSASAKFKADVLTLHADLLAASGRPEDAKQVYEIRDQSVRTAFQENLAKLRSGQESEKAKAELAGLVPYLEQSLKTDSQHTKFEDLKKLKEFYILTGNMDKLTEVVGELRAQAKELREKHTGTYKYGTNATAEQVVETRLVVQIDIELKDASNLEQDDETYNQFLLYAPQGVKDQTSSLEELMGMYKGLSEMKGEAAKLPDPPPVKNEEGYLVEQRSDKDKIQWSMGRMQGEINRLIEKKERERIGVTEGALPKESSERLSVVSDLLLTLEYSDGEGAQRARDRLFGNDLDSYIDKKSGADLFLSKADEVKDPQEKRAVLVHALREYVALKDDSGVRKTIEAIQATLPNLPKGPEELMERLQTEQVIQTAVKGAYPEIEAKFKKSCESDVAVLQGMLELGETADGKKLSAQQKYQIALTITGNSFVDSDNSLTEDGFLTGSSVDDAKQSLHAKLEGFKKTRDYQAAMDRGGDGRKKDLKPTYASTQKLWFYLNDQPEYALLSFEDRKAFLKSEGYGISDEPTGDIGDIMTDAIKPGESASTRQAIFMARQAKRMEDKGQPEEASKIYKAALEKNPDDVNARIGYARSLLSWEKIAQKVSPNPKRLQESQSEGIKQMDEILKKNPRNWEAKGVRLEIVLDQKYSDDPKGKLEFLRKEFDENITLYEGLAAKDKEQGQACLGYLRGIANRFHSNFENPSSADELKDLARAYRLFKDIPKKSEEEQGIFQHYLGLLDRNMNGIKDGTITYDGVDPLVMAQTIYEIDTQVRKMPDFEIAKDLENWQKEVENCPPDALNDKDRASQYGKMLKEWLRLRDRANSGDPTTKGSDGMTEKNIKPLAQALKKTILQGNTSPNAAAKLDQFFERLIDSNDVALRGALTPDGLSGFIDGANQLDQSFENAKKLTGAKEKRAALLGVIESAKALRDEKTAEAAVTLYQESFGVDISADDHLKTTLDLNQALKDSKFAVADKVHESAVSEVQSSWKELESKNDTDPSTVRRLLMVADFMGKERIEGGPKIAAKAKEKVKMIRAVLVNNLDGKFEEGFRPATDDERTEMQEALKSSHPITDLKERAQASKLVSDIDRALLQDSLNEAGDDAEKKEKISARILTDFSRWHAAVGKVDDYSPSEKAEQLSLLTSAAFSFERMGKEPNPVFREGAFTEGVKGQIDALQKESKEISAAQSKAAFDLAIPAGSLPDADREKLWKSFEKDFSPLFDKAWEDRNKPGQESSAMIRIKSFTSPESLSQIVQDWKKADDLVKSYHSPLTKEDMESTQKAVQIFGGLGMTERVKEAMAPLITVAHNPNLPLSDRVMVLNMIAQLYQQGGMTTEANASLQEIIDIGESKDATPELKEAGVLAKAFQFLNKGEVDKGEDVLASLPDNKTAKAVLESIREGRKRCRGMQLMAALRAYYDNYEAGKDAEDGIIIKTVTAGSWEQKFDDAAKEDLRVNRGRLDMIEQWMVVDGYDFHQAVQMAFIDDPKAYHEFNMCLERFSTDMNMYINNLPRDLVTRTLDPAKANIGWLSDPLLSEADFGNGLYRFAEGLRDQGMFSAASQVAQVISDNNFVGGRAKTLLTQSIPDAQKKDAFMKGIVMSMTGASILEAKSWGDVAWEAVMFVGPMAAGNALGALGKGMYAARAVGVASRVEGFLLRVGIGAEEAAVWGARASEVGAWTAKSGAEALGFTIFETGAERIRTGKLIYADDFMKKWGGMMVTFGLCHVTGSWAAEKGETARWLTGVGSFMAADIINENIGLKEKSHEDWATRFVNAVKGDLSMRVAGALVNAGTGGYFHGVEMRAEESLRENQYARFAEHLGLDTSRDWKGEFKPETARVIQEAMGFTDARGIDPRKTADVVKFQNELKEIVPRAEVDRAVKALDPGGEHSQALRAAVFSYVISEMSKTASPEADAKAPEKVEAAASPSSKEKSQASKLMAEIPVKMEPILGLKLPGEFKSAVIENVLVKGMNEGEIKALSEQLPEIGESFKAMTEKLGDKAAHLLLRQAVRGAIKVEDISKHLKALTEQMETLEKTLKEGLKGKGELKEAELQEAMEKLLLAALEISQAAEDPKLLEKALQALTQNFIEERQNDQKAKRALEETLQKAKERTAEVRGKKFAEEREREREKGRQGKEKEEGPDELGGVGKKKGTRSAGEADIPEKGPLTRDQALHLARERFGLEGELTESQVKKTYKAWYSENSPEARAQKRLPPLPNYIYAERSALRDVLLRDVCKVELKTADEARVKDYLAGKITRAPRETASVREAGDQVVVDREVEGTRDEGRRAEEGSEEREPIRGLREARPKESISEERDAGLPEFEVSGALLPHVEVGENKAEVNALSLGSDAAPSKAPSKESVKETPKEKPAQVIPLATFRRYADRVLASAAAVLGITFISRPAEAAELGTSLRRGAETFHSLLSSFYEAAHSLLTDPMIVGGTLTTMAFGFGAAALAAREVIRSEKAREKISPEEEETGVRKKKSGERESGGQGKGQGQGEERQDWGTEGGYGDMAEVLRAEALKPGYRIPTFPPNPLLRDPLRMGSFFDRLSVQSVRGENGEVSFREVKLIQAQEPAGSEWKGGEPQFHFRETWHVEDKREADQESLNSFIWWGRNLIEANRDRSTPLNSERAQNLQRQFDRGATVHAIHGKTPLRFELVTHNERGDMRVEVVDIATFEAYVGHVERSVARATEALKERREWPRVELPTQEPIDVSEHATLIEEPVDVTEHAQLVEEPLDVTEHAQLIEEGPVPIRIESPLPRFPLSEEVDATLRSMSRAAAELPAAELDIRSVTLHPPKSPGVEGEFVMKIEVGEGFASADRVKGELLARGHEIESDGSIRMKLADGQECRVIVEEPPPSVPHEEVTRGHEERIEEITDADIISVEEKSKEEKAEELTEADFIEVNDFLTDRKFMNHLKNGATAIPELGKGRYKIVGPDGEVLGWVERTTYRAFEKGILPERQGRILARLSETFKRVFQEFGLDFPELSPLQWKKTSDVLSQGDLLLEKAPEKLAAMEKTLRERLPEVQKDKEKAEAILKEVLWGQHEVPLGERGVVTGDVIAFRSKATASSQDAAPMKAAAKGGAGTDRAEAGDLMPPALKKAIGWTRQGVGRLWDSLLDPKRGSHDKMLAVGPVAMLPFLEHGPQIGMLAVVGMAMGVSMAKSFRRAAQASREDPIRCRVLEGEAEYKLWPQFLGEAEGGQPTPLMKITHQEFRGEELILHLKPETDIQGRRITKIAPEFLVVTLSAEEAARLSKDAEGKVRGVNYRIDTILQEAERAPDSQFRFQQYQFDVMKLFLVKMGFDGLDPQLPAMARALAQMTGMAGIAPEVFENPREVARELGKNPAIMDRLSQYASEKLRTQVDEVMGVNADGIPPHETVEGRQFLATLLLMRVQTGKDPGVLYQELAEGLGKILSERLNISENDPLREEWTQRLLKFSIRSGITLQGDVPSILNGLELSLEGLSPQFAELLEGQGLARGKSFEAAQKILLTVFLEKGSASDAIQRPETWANYLDEFATLKGPLEALSQAVFRDPSFYAADVPRFKGEFFLSLLTRVGSFGELQKKLKEYGQNAPLSVQRLSARIDDAMGPNQWGQKVNETAKGLQVLAKVFSMDPGLEHLGVSDAAEGSFDPNLLKMAEGFRDGFDRKEIWAQDLDREGMPEAGRKVADRVKRAVAEMDVLLDALVAADRVLDLRQLPRRRIQEIQRTLANPVELVDRWTRYHEKRLGVQNLIEDYLLPFKQTFLRIRDAERTVEEFGLPEIAALGEAHSPFPLTIEEGLTIRHSHRSPEFGADFFEDLNSTQQYEGVIHVGSEALRDLLMEECLKGEGEVFSKSLPLLKSGRDFIIRPHPEDPHALQVTSVKERTTFALRFEVAAPLEEAPPSIFPPPKPLVETTPAEIAAAARAEEPQSIRGSELQAPTAEKPGVIGKVAKWLGILGAGGLAMTAFMESAQAAVEGGAHASGMDHSSAMVFGALTAFGILGAFTGGRGRRSEGAGEHSEDLMGDNRRHNKQVRAIEQMVAERLLEAQVEIPIDEEIQRKIHDAMVHYKENRLGRRNANVPREAFGEIAEGIASELISSRKARGQQELPPSSPASQAAGGPILLREDVTAEIDRLIDESLSHRRSPLSIEDPRVGRVREILQRDFLRQFERFQSEFPEIQTFEDLQTYGFFSGKNSKIRDFILRVSEDPDFLESMASEAPLGLILPPPGSSMSDVSLPKAPPVPNPEFAQAEFEMGEQFRALGISWEVSVTDYMKKSLSDLKANAQEHERQILEAIEADLQKTFPKTRRAGEYNPFDYTYRQAVERLLSFVAHWKIWERTGAAAMGPMERNAFFAPFGREYGIRIPAEEGGFVRARGLEGEISERPPISREGKTAKIPMDREKITAPIAKRETPTVRIPKDAPNMNQPAAAKGIQNPPSGRVDVGRREEEVRFESPERRRKMAEALVSLEEAGMRDLVGDVSEGQVEAAKAYLAHGENPPSDSDFSFLEAGYAYNVHVEGGRRRGSLIFAGPGEGSSTLERWEVTAVEGDRLSLRSEKGEALQVQGDAIRKKSIAHPFEVGDTVQFLPQIAGGAPTAQEAAEAQAKKSAPITPVRQQTPPFGFEAFTYQRPAQVERGDYEFMVFFGGVKQEIVNGQIVRRPRWFLTVNSGTIPDLPFPRFVEVNGQRVEGMNHEILPGQKIRSWDGKEFSFEPPAVDVTPEKASPWAQGRGQPAYAPLGQVSEAVSPWAAAAKGVENPPGGRVETSGEGEGELESSPLSQPKEPRATPVPVAPLAVLTFQGPEIIGRERFPEFSNFVSRQQAQLHWENGKFWITHLSQNVKTSVIHGRTGEHRTLEQGKAEPIELGDIIHLGVEFVRFGHGNGQYLLLPVEPREVPRQPKPVEAPVGEALVPQPIVSVGEALQASAEELSPGVEAERHLISGGKGPREVVPMGTSPQEKVFVLGSFRGTKGDLPPNYYRIPAASVSSRHAEVRIKDGALTVRDLGSHNGTWVWKAATGDYVTATEGPVTVDKGDFIFLAGADPESRVALSVDPQGRIYSHENLEEWGDLPRKEAPPWQVITPSEGAEGIPLLPPGTHPSPDGSIEFASLVPPGSGQRITLYVETGHAKTDSLATPSILISVPNANPGGAVPLVSPPPVVYGEIHATKQGWELQKKIGGRVVVTQGPAHTQEKPAEKNGRVRLADGDLVQVGRMKFRFEERGAKLIPFPAPGETMPPMVRLNAAPMAAAAKELRPSRRSEGEREGSVIEIGDVSTRNDQPTLVRLAVGEAPVFHLWQRNGKYYLQLTAEGRRQGLSLSNESGPMNIKAMSPTLIEAGKISVQRESGEAVTFDLPRSSPATPTVSPSLAPQAPKPIEGPLPLLRDRNGENVTMKPQSDGSLEIAKQVVIQQKGDGQWVLIDRRDPSQVQTPEESKSSIRHAAVIAHKLFPVQINERTLRPGEEVVLQAGDSIVVIPSLMGKIQFPKPNPFEKGLSQWSATDQARFQEGIGKARTFKEVRDWVHWTRLPGAEVEAAVLDACLQGTQTLDHLSPKVRERMVALMDYYTREGQAFLPKGFSPSLERPSGEGLIPTEASYRATRAALQLSDRMSQARTMEDVIQAILETPLSNPEGLNKKVLLEALQKLKSGEGGIQEIPRGFGIRQKLRDIQEARMHRFHIGAEGIPVSVRDSSLQMELQRLTASENSLYGPTTQIYRDGRVFQRSWKGLTHAQALEQIYLVLHRGHPVEKITSEHGVRQAVEYHMTQVIATAQRLYSKEWNQAGGRNLFTGEKIREGDLDTQYRFARMLINQKTGQPIFGMPTGAEIHTLLQFTSRLSGGKVQSYEEAQAVIRDHFTRFTPELQAHLANQFMDSETKALIIETFFGPYQHRQLDNPRQAFQLARFLGGIGFYREVGVTVDVESGGQVHTNLTLGDLGSVSPEDRHVYFVMHTHPELYENEQGRIMGEADPGRGNIAGTFVFGAGRKSVDTTNTVFSTQDVILFRQTAERIFREAQYNSKADLSIFYDRTRHVFRNWVQHPYGFAEVQVQLDPVSGRAKGIEIRYVAEDGRDPNKGHQYQAKKLMDLTRQQNIKNDPKRGENPLFGIPITVRRVTDVNERWQMERAMPYPNPSQK